MTEPGLPRADRLGGRHDGDSLFDAPAGSDEGVVELDLPTIQPLPEPPTDPTLLPSQDDPDRPDLLRFPAPQVPAGGPDEAEPGPLTTTSAAPLVAPHGGQNIRPRRRF